MILLEPVPVPDVCESCGQACSNCLTIHLTQDQPDQEGEVDEIKFTLCDICRALLKKLL